MISLKRNRTWKRHSFITDFPLPVCSGCHSGCVFTQQAFRSSWRLECVLDHGSDYRDHIPFHLPQGNRKTHNGGPKAMNIVLLHCSNFIIGQIFLRKK